MAAMEPNSVDAIVTDPPYGLSLMGKDWDHGVPGVEFWAAMLRVLKPGGHLMAFGGTRTFHRMGVAIEDAGFEIKDTLSWLYGSGFPKHKSLLKPGWEPIILARKKGASVLNIDACRIGTEERPVMVRTSTIVAANSMAGESTGATSSGEMTTLGRWPANVILDSDAAALLDAMSGERKSGGTGGGGKTFHGQTYVKPERTMEPSTGGASRFFYCAKASSRERHAGLDSPSTHPTVKPLALMRWLVRLACPPGGLVLDPFAGSGSTGCAAEVEGFDYILIEQEAEYIPIIERRTAHWRTHARQLEMVS